MRLANEIAAGAMEHVQGRLRPGMTRERGRRDVERLRPRRTGPAATGQVELAHGFSLVWSGPGIRTFTATGSRPVQEHEPTLFEIWVCADGYWCDHTKNLVPGRADAAVRGARSSSCLAVYDAAVAFCRARREPRRARPARPRGHRRAGYPGQPSPPDLPRRRRPRARAAVRAPGRRRHDRGGHGARDRARRLLAGGRRPAPRGQLPDHRRRRREALAASRTGSFGHDDRPRPALDRRPERARARAADARPVGLYDTTLRDGEQTVGVVLDPEEKLEIARALDELGVDRIEAGFPRVSEDDAEAVRLIAAAGLERRDLGLLARGAGRRRGARRARRAAQRDRVADLATRKLAALGVSRETCSSRIRNAVSFAAGAGDHGRVLRRRRHARRPRLLRSASTRRRSRQARRRSSSSTRSGSPRPRRSRSSSEHARVARLDVPVHFHGHNDFGLATAAAVAAVRAGATWVQGTINGMGERAGNANLLEVALALEALYGVPTRPRALDSARESRRARARPVRATSSSPGSRSSARTSSRARAAPSRASSTTRPRSSPTRRSSSAPSARIVLGKKSGLDSIRIKCEELGLDVPEERHARAARGGEGSSAPRSAASSPTSELRALRLSASQDRR